MRAISGITGSLLLALVGCSLGTEPPAGETDTRARQIPLFGSKPLVVPAGAEVYVRLQQHLSSSTAENGETFTALLDQALTAENQKVAEPGAVATGKVIAVRKAGGHYGGGYIRITLTSIALQGKLMPLETNSVFVVGSSRKRGWALRGSGTGSAALLRALTGANGSLGVSPGEGGTAGAPGSAKEAGFAADQLLVFRLMQPLEAPGDREIR